MMQGVRFHKAMSPWAPGDTALLTPEAADRVVREGFATPHVFPDKPFAVDASAESAPAPAAFVEPAQRRAQSYRTKRVG